WIPFVVVLSGASVAEWKPTPVPTSAENSANRVWFRCFIQVPDNMATPAQADLWRDSITLSLGGMAGPFAVFLNGQKIAEGNALTTGERRRFKVPKGILEKQSFNVLALRLEGEA